MRAIDLFSGPGGLTLGLKNAGIEPICSVEINKDACETYSWHTSVSDHYCSDVRKIDFRKYKGKIEIVYGGPPCQPFSTGGLNKGNEDNRNMIPEFIRVVRETNPLCFIMENVPGLITKSHSGYFFDALTALEGMGYIVNWSILNTANYGVPQKRKRVIAVGVRDRTFKFPTPSHGPESSNPYVAAGEVIGLRPIGDTPNAPVKFAKYPDLRPSPYHGHIYNGGGRPINLSEPCPTILASAGGYKTHWIDTLGIAEIGSGLLSGVIVMIEEKSKPVG
jgi:DNA (cytosine-5)-methyltransferase 1